MPFVDKARLAQLEYDSNLLNRCRMQTYWMRQPFVFTFIDQYVRGHDIATLRRQFDKDLEAYVESRCAEKLAQANQVVSEVEKINLADPFHSLRLSIRKFRGES